MTFQRIEPERIAGAIRRQIEGLILRGILRPGERLPSERDLAGQLEVSRPSLREALSELEDEGLIETRAGAGAYVADVLGSAFAPPLIRLFSTHSEALFDYLSFRRDLEGLAAERA
ncbi:MAG: GntR family transcriptional regulator, partial [Pseudomonadota bacterium]